MRSSPLYPAEEANLDDTGRFTISNVAGEFAMTVRGLPPGWRVRRISRAGTLLSDNRVTVRLGEGVAGIEIIVGNSSR